MSRRGGCLLSVLLLAASSLAQASLPELVQQLGSNDGRKRSDAFRALQNNRSPEVVALVGKHVEGFSGIGQEQACNLLRRFPLTDTRAVYLQMASSGSPYLRAIGAGRLVSMHVKASERALRARMIRVLVAALAECDAQRVMSAVNSCSHVLDEVLLVPLRALLTIDRPAHIAVGVLRDLLRRERGTSMATRDAAAGLLAAREPRVLGAAHAYLLRDDASHGKPLVQLLKEHRQVLWDVQDLLPGDKLGDDVAEVLAEALRSPRSDHDIRRLAGILRQSSPVQLKAALRDLLGHERDSYREVALVQLAALPGGLSDKDLLELLQGDALPARVLAAATLRRRDNPAGLAALLSAAQATGKHQADAARALGDFRSTKAIPVLLDLLDAADQRVRNDAWTGLQKTLRSLYPYRKFDFRNCGYAPAAASRSSGIATLRAWWAASR